MVCYFLIYFFCIVNLYFIFLDQIIDEFRVVNNFIISAEFLILISDSLQTMWTADKYFIELILFHRVNIFLDHCLRKKLISQPARRITIAFFFSAKHREINSRFIKKLRNRARDIPVSLVK